MDKNQDKDNIKTKKKSERQISLEDEWAPSKPDCSQCGLCQRYFCHNFFHIQINILLNICTLSRTILSFWLCHFSIKLLWLGCSTFLQRKSITLRPWNMKHEENDFATASLSAPCLASHRGLDHQRSCACHQCLPLCQVSCNHSIWSILANILWSKLYYDEEPHEDTK